MEKLIEKIIYENDDMCIYLEANLCKNYYDTIGFRNVGRIIPGELADESEKFYKEFDKLIDLLNSSNVSEKEKVEAYLCFCADYDGHNHYYVVEDKNEIPAEENAYYFKINGIWVYDEL